MAPLAGQASTDSAGVEVSAGLKGLRGTDRVDRQEVVVKKEGQERAMGVAKGLQASLKTADLHLSKAFAGGRVYCSTLVDKLLCESFYNSRIIRVIELFVHADTHGSRLFLHQLPLKFIGRPFREVFVHQLLRIRE